MSGGELSGLLGSLTGGRRHRKKRGGDLNTVTTKGGKRSRRYKKSKRGGKSRRRSRSPRSRRQQ